MDIYTLIKVFSRRIWILLGVALSAALVAFLLTLGYEREYKSAAQLSTGFTIKEAVRLTDEGYFNAYESNIKFDNLIATLESPAVVGLLSYDLLLHDLTSSFPFRQLEKEEEAPSVLVSDTEWVQSILKDKIDSTQMLTSFLPKEKQILELLRRYEYDYKSLNDILTIDRVDRTDYVAIECISKNPEFSAYVVNTLCKMFFRYNEVLRLERSNESVEFFAKLVNQKRSALEEKSDQLRQFKASQGVINFSVESESKIEQIVKYESALEEEQKKYRSLQLSLNNLNQQLERTDGTSSDAANSSNAEILTIRRNITELSNKYIETGSSNQELQDKISELRDELNRLLTKMGQYRNQRDDSRALAQEKNTVEVDLEIARQNIQSLQTTLNRLRANVGTYVSKEAQIDDLERDVQLASEEYSSAQEKYSAALNVSSITGSDIRQVLFGQPAVEPEPSQRLIITALAGASAFSLSLIVLIFLQYIDFSISTPSYFSKITGLKLIGKINKLSDYSTLKNPLFTTSNQKSKQQTLFRELLKKIRYEVERSSAKIILFTSTQPGEGKTMVIESLLHAHSLTKKKMLVIDTNFAHTSLTKHFSAKPVLENAVNDMSTTSLFDVKKMVTPTKIPGVDIIGCKGGHYSPSEILSSCKFSSVLDELKGEYDYIFMEGSALNVYPDTKELVKFADGLIAVFSANSIIKQSDRESIDFLNQMGDKFLGAILNNIDSENIEH